MSNDVFTISRFISLAVALWLLWSIRTNLIDWFKSQRWQGTQGVIRSASYERQPGIYSHAPPFKKRNGNTFLTLSFEYEVNGRKFVGHRVSFDESLISTPMNLVDGQSVRVWYSPENPSHSVIYRRCPGVVFIVLALLFYALLGTIPLKSFL